MADTEVLTTAQFADRGHGMVSLAVAPDGLPLYLNLGPPPAAAELLQPTAVALRAAPTTLELDGTPLEPVARLLTELLRGARLRTVETLQGQVKMQVIPMDVREFAGETLLTRLFANATAIPSPPGAPLPGPPAAAARVPQTSPAPAAMAISHGDGPAFSRSDLWLGLCIESGRVAILRRSMNARGWPEYEFARYFQSESLRAFEGAALVKREFPGDASVVQSVPATDGERYRAVREREWDEQVGRGFGLGSQGNWAVRVPRNAIARVLLDLAVSVARLHSAGQVHGDLKTSNALVTSKGVRVLDGLGLAPGQRSPAMTLGWAAPEQVLAEPVSFQTDQYAIGLLFLALVQGVAYGEQVSVIVPRGGRELEQHTLLRNPGAFIDPAQGTVDRAAIEDWRSLIERCIRFDAAQRFPATMTLIDALKRLIERDTLIGFLETPVRFGQILGRFRTTRGHTEFGWLSRTLAG